MHVCKYNIQYKRKKHNNKETKASEDVLDGHFDGIFVVHNSESFKIFGKYTKY